MEARGPTGRGEGGKELWDRSLHGCLQHIRSHFQPQALPPTRYLFGPELHCLLSGFFKIFLLADVGLTSRSRENPSAQGQKEELRRVSPPSPCHPPPHCLHPMVSPGQVSFTHNHLQMKVVFFGWLRSQQEGERTRTRVWGHRTPWSSLESSFKELGGLNLALCTWPEGLQHSLPLH